MAETEAYPRRLFVVSTVAIRSRPAGSTHAREQHNTRPVLCVVVGRGADRAAVMQRVLRVDASHPLGRSKKAQRSTPKGAKLRNEQRLEHNADEAIVRSHHTTSHGDDYQSRLTASRLDLDVSFPLALIMPASW